MHQEKGASLAQAKEATDTAHQLSGQNLQLRRQPGRAWKRLKLILHRCDVDCLLIRRFAALRYKRLSP